MGCLPSSSVPCIRSGTYRINQACLTQKFNQFSVWAEEPCKGTFTLPSLFFSLLKVDSCEKQTGVEEDVPLASLLGGRSVFVRRAVCALRFWPVRPCPLFSWCFCSALELSLCRPLMRSFRNSSAPNMLLLKCVTREEGHIVRQEVFMLDISCPTTHTHTHTHPDTSGSVGFCKWKPMKLRHSARSECWNRWHSP